MLENIKLDKVLFLDIETVPSEANFEDLDTTFQKLWEEKTIGKERRNIRHQNITKLKEE